jgi:hypothetical protein|tara:strand:- start:2093 stop:2461 length:369 start_codon:yes stop_codon:yes gene_type:complete
MSIDVPISYGELYDKISILEIKLEKGIKSAKKEYESLLEVAEELYEPIYVTGFRHALKAINSQCWEIENIKRQCERDNIFDENFIETSRAVYILNDERARMKSLINKYMKSDIYEYKNHKDY